MYTKAFRSSAILASSSLVTAFVIVLNPWIWSKRLGPLCANLWRSNKWRFALLMPLSVCPPLFLFAIYLIYSYRHSTSSKKSKERLHLEQAEFLWNSVDTVEAGFEASGEILLQVWVLGPKIVDISTMGIKEIINGILFLEGATDTQKSVGKVIIAVLSVMYSVGECYRVQKREAVNMFFDIFPVYTSVLLQAIARVIAFSMLFSSSKGSSGGETVTFLAIHIILAFFIRLLSTKQWVKARKREGYTFGWYDLIMKFLVDIVAAFCSCLVYCNGDRFNS